MNTVVVIYLLFLAAAEISGHRPWRPQHAFKTANKVQCDANDGPLILTPYITSGEIQLAQQLSEVDSLHHYHRKSYSGYFTVNATDNSNMFFWFFPAEIDEPTEAPLVLWLQGNVPNRYKNYRKLIRIPSIVFELPCSSSFSNLFFSNG